MPLLLCLGAVFAGNQHASAAMIKQKPPLGFVAADERDYENQRELCRATVLKGF